MHDVLRFWLDRGVDGFRVDVIQHCIEDEQAAATTRPTRIGAGHAARPTRWLQIRTDRSAGAHDVVAGDAAGRRRYPRPGHDRRGLPAVDRLMTYYGADLDGLHLPFNFHLLTTPGGPRRSPR